MSNPDMYYYKPFSIAWIYDKPNLYWLDPKKLSIMKNSKVYKTIDDLQIGFTDEFHRDRAKERIRSIWREGGLTHSQLANYVDIDYRTSAQDRYVRGRLSPGGKEVGVWDYDPYTRVFKGNEKIFDKAIDAIYKHMKRFVK